MKSENCGACGHPQTEIRGHLHCPVCESELFIGLPGFKKSVSQIPPDEAAEELLISTPILERGEPVVLEEVVEEML